MEKYKYPRTYHLPYSEGASSDDKMLDSDECFIGQAVIITEKMDGENTTVYPDGTFHARSLDSKHRDYHSWLLNDIQKWAYLIPEGCRVCGEYLYAKHSIAYENLVSYFLAFNIWKDDICLSWIDTLDIIRMINDKVFLSCPISNDLKSSVTYLEHVSTVPVIYGGIYNKDKVIEIAKRVISQGGEGIVVRKTCSFTIDEFNTSVAKYVRPNHVETDRHWSFSEITPNNLMS